MSLQVTPLYQRSIYCSHDLYLCLCLIHSASLHLPISAATVRLACTCAVIVPGGLLFAVSHLLSPKKVVSKLPSLYVDNFDEAWRPFASCSIE